jgi:hypothetical protein
MPRNESHVSVRGLLSLGYGRNQIFRKKVKIQEERRSMNYVEGTMTDIGLKWPKKWKRRSKVMEKEFLNEKIKEDRSTRKMDHGQLNKQKKSTNRFFGAPHGKEGKIGWQILENTGQVDLGF